MAEYGRRRKKVCMMCTGATVDYKNPETLKRYVNEKSKIVSRRVTGNCARHQREISKQIKRARAIALMPYTR
ncbi:MAG TPA: 30S ribosomal protein S18 [Candidatus Faecimonas gallistercoris]|nr:30S ribosomal protein S18 [Candidatus Faecimonas gallistercoris]